MSTCFETRQYISLNQEKTNMNHFKCIDNALSPNNSNSGDHVDRIYSMEFKIKDTTDTARSASNLNIHL
jgi:hypothetical protein